MKTILPHILILIFAGSSICCQSKKGPDHAHILRYKVTDHAHILTTAQEDSLTMMLENLESDVGSQIAILTITSLDGQKIEDFSLQTAKATRLGRATHDDGVLITIAMNEKQMRIEVGTGLENILKNEIAASIIREDMAPNFQQERFALGLYLAVNRISNLIKEHENRIGEEPR